MSLPTDPKARKQLQLYTFMFGYFPDAWLAIVDVARKGNEQHNPGEPLHWSREKSTDQMNAVFNHLFDYGTGSRKDVDGAYHLAKLAWRTMAQLQLDIEGEQSSELVTAMEKAWNDGLKPGPIELRVEVPTLVFADEPNVLRNVPIGGEHVTISGLETLAKKAHDTCPWCLVLKKEGVEHRPGCPELELTVGEKSPD